MKTALLRYDSKNGTYKNIGDYIQSIAAKQFVGNDAILLEREQLHEYKGDPVKLIMAAWWMHYPENWPPAKNIIPLFISFHITPNHAKKMLNENGVSYLKKHEPIGCRDKGTQHLLETYGIKSYFSGCLTLTLSNKYKYQPIKNNGIFIDPYFDIPRLKKPLSFIKPLFTLLTQFKTILKISKKMYSSTSLKSMLRVASFYRVYSKLFDKKVLLMADYYTHSVYEPNFKSEQEKFDYADQLLQYYTQSRFIVTSRLHASLPTIAMGIPTLFVYNENIPRSAGRFEGLLEHVNCIQYQDEKWNGLNGFKLPHIISIEYKFTNKNTHINLSDLMSDTCYSFVKKD